MTITKKQRENVKTFLRRWAEVPPENVAPELCYFRAPGDRAPPTCNTLACAGGWLPFMPEFADWGVMPNEDGAPIMPLIGLYWVNEVAMELFGRQSLFAGRGLIHSEDEFRGSDHDLVTHRFQSLLKD
jgi:hypothetical protein